MAEIVTKALICSGREIPSREHARLIVAAWDDVLEPVPTERLNDAYRRAIRERDMPGIITPQEIFTAWKAIADHERQVAIAERHRADMAYLDAPPPLSPEENARLAADVRAGLRVVAAASSMGGAKESIQ